MPKRSGALFHRGTCTASDLPRFVEALKDHSKQMELVQAVFDLCNEDEEGCTDMPSMEERLNIKRSTVLQRVEGLVKLRLVRSDMKQTQPGVRGRTIYSLLLPDAEQLPVSQSPEEIGDLLVPEGSEPSQWELGLDPHHDSTELTYHPQMDRRMTFRGERFSALHMIGALRLGRGGEDKRHKIVRLWLGAAWMDVEVEASGDALIASVLDLSTLIVVTTLLLKHYEPDRPQPDPTKGYVVRMTDLCEAMYLKPNPGNKRMLYQRLERWNSTRFKILRRSPDAILWAKGYGVDEKFYFISRMETLTRLSKREGATPEIVHLFMDQRLIDALPDRKRTLVMHSEMLRERNPSQFDHLFYLWCRRVVKHSWNPKVYDVEHLAREMRPGESVESVCGEIGEMMDRRHLDEHTRGVLADVFGYHVRFSPKDRQVAINAKRDDPLLGENSGKAQEARKILAEGKRIAEAKSP